MLPTAPETAERRHKELEFAYLAALVARHEAVTLQLASPGCGVLASSTLGIVGSSYRHSIHDLTGRGRFTLFA